MTDIDPVHRLGAKEAKDILGAIVYSMAPDVNIVPDLVQSLPHSDTITVTQVRSTSHIKGWLFLFYKN